MKTLNFILPVLLTFVFSTTLMNCVENTDTGEAYLDSELFGTWIAVDSQNIAHIITFSADSTYVQESNGEVRNYLWEIWEGEIRLYTEDGSWPTVYKEYKVEEDRFHYWIESLNNWGIPFYKQ
jgi:hypothetical protein